MKKRNKKEVVLVVATVIAAILIGSGCTHTWNYPPLKMDDQYRNIAYKYYVIDANEWASSSSRKCTVPLGNKVVGGSFLMT